MIYFIKFLYNFFLPPGIFILALFYISFSLYRRQKRNSIMLAVIALLLYIISTPIMGDFLIRTLEKSYNLPPVIEGDLLLMLGGGATSDTPNVNSKGHPTGSSANRILTTAILYKKTGLTILISSGQVYKDDGNEAVIAKKQLINLGIPEEKIIIEDKSRNTKENVQFTNKLLKKYHFKKPILITSAFHMKRAVKNFNSQGINVIPYPTDYKVSLHSSFYINKLVPTSGDLFNTYTALHEFLGIIAV